MKKARQIVPLVLMLTSLPFYFIGLFSLKNENGVRIVGTWDFLSFGITGKYGAYFPYFYPRGPKFINAILVMLAVSLVFFVVYALMHLLKRDEKKQDAYFSLVFVFSLLTHAAYATAIIILAFFYTNKFHASYIINGSSSLGIGAILGMLLQFPAVMFYIMNWFNYVIDPKIEKRRAKKYGYDEDEEETIPNQNQNQQLTQNNPVQTQVQQIPLNQTVNPYLVMDNVPKGVLGVIPNTVTPIHPAPPVYQKPVENNRYYLVISKGEMKGGRIPLHDNEKIIIGKDPKNCTIVINSKFAKVSRVHCYILRKGEKIYIKDSSTNGTYYSATGERIPTKVLTKLENGQKFNLAKTENEFYCRIK